MKRLKLAGIGCGGRTRTYLGLAAERPTLFEVVAAADPNTERLHLIRDLSRNPDFQCFPDDKALLAQPKLADVLVIGTQDAYHVEPCIAAMKKGYDILLEKPISPIPSDVLALEHCARELSRRVMVCHVLRYTPFYEKVKEILSSGALGQVVALHASEGVGPWHQAHSFVRGHWAVRENSSPMLLAKSCHDMDILCWLIDRPCRSVSSFGHLQHFHRGNKPESAPPRCTDGCPVGQTCPYNALRYLKQQRGWLQWVMDGAQTATDAQIIDWLRVSPWGRCVYQCENNVVDRQVLAMDFDGGVNATFTMTAFDTGRNLEIMGTLGSLRGGDFLSGLGCELLLREHATGNVQRFNISIPEGGHGGGDVGLVNHLHHEMSGIPASEMRSSLEKSVASHLITFAAERSRETGQTVDLAKYRSEL